MPRVHGARPPASAARVPHCSPSAQRHPPAAHCDRWQPRAISQGGSAISGEAEGVAVEADGSAVPQAPEGMGQFGWHMWTQALVAGKWMDLDATLHVPYSVGHVLVGTSSMSDKEAHNNHMQMAALIGNLEIDLLDYSHEWQQ